MDIAGEIFGGRMMMRESVANYVRGGRKNGGRIFANVVITFMTSTPIVGILAL